MKEFLKSEAWKFVVLAGVVLAVSALTLYFVCRSDESLDFHESWSQAERDQITECYQRNTRVSLARVVMLTGGSFAEDDSFFDRCFRFITNNFAGYPRRMLSEYFFGSIRRMIEETASSGNATISDKNSLSLLHIALGFGKYELARCLVGRGADVNQCPVVVDGFYGDAPLALCASVRTVDLVRIPASKRREMVDFLHKNSADFKARVLLSRHPVTILAVANFISVHTEVSKEEEESFLIYLLEKGAPSVWKSEDGESRDLLGIAINFKMPRVVRYLQDHGADTLKLTDEEKKKMKKLLDAYEFDASCLRAKRDSRVNSF